jgi:DNA-binding MarR family transcriptional regulator
MAAQSVAVVHNSCFDDTTKSAGAIVSSNTSRQRGGRRTDAARIDDSMTAFARLVRGPRLFAAMGSATPDAVEPSLYPVLVGIVDLGPMRLSDLCDTVALRMSTLSRHVSELEARGLVRRETDRSDSRAVRLTTTARGRRVVERVRSAWWGTIDEVTADWTSSEKQQFVAAMDRFRSGLVEVLARDGHPEDQQRPR